jgi:hypothetical protein
MDRSDVEKYRDSSDKKSDTAYIYTHTETEIDASKMLNVLCNPSNIYKAVDNVQTYSNSLDSYSILSDQLLNWLAVSVLLIMH